MSWNRTNPKKQKTPSGLQWESYHCEFTMNIYSCAGLKENGMFPPLLYLSLEAKKMLSCFQGTLVWAKGTLDSISEALLQLVWLYQPTETIKWSGGSTASLRGSLPSVFWLKASRQRVLQKHHLPTLSPLPRSAAQRSCIPPHTLQKDQYFQLQILPTVTRNYTASPWVFSYS